jgi:hypothetical protein
MDTLFGAGIDGKLYRLLFMLNKDTHIRVKTSFRVTDVTANCENVAQVSIGGGIISALNLDKTIGAQRQRTELWTNTIISAALSR